MPLKHTALILFGVLLFSCKEKPKEESSSSSAKKTPPAVPQAQKRTPNTLACFDDLQGNVKRMTKSTYLAREQNKKVIKVSLGTLYNTTYDKSGNGIERSYRNATGNLLELTKYSVGPQNRIVTSTIYNGSDKMIRRTEYTYDKQSILSEEKLLDSKGQFAGKIKYTYNSLGQLIREEKTGAAKNPEWITTYSYNQQGRSDQIKYQMPLSNTTIVCRKTYSDFDHRGNWLQSTERTTKGSFFLIERKIEYHD